MTQRILLIGLSVVACGLALWVVVVRAGEITSLQAEKKGLLVVLSGSPPTQSLLSTASTTVHPGGISASPELLRLRNEVSQLTRRRSELAGVQAENQRLRTELASANTSLPSGKPLPPGYIRRSQAQWVGYSTPEDTMQSFLWALQHRDLTNILQAVQDPETLGMGRSPEDILHGMEFLPGFTVTSKQPRPDGSVDLQVQVGADDATSEQVHLKAVNGQWRIVTF